MERENHGADRIENLVDLGQASVETQGIVGREEDVNLQLKQIGLSDE